MFLAVIFWHVQFGFTIRNFSPEKFHKHPNSTFWHRSTHFWSQWVLLFYLPSSQLYSLWGHAKFYFEPSTDESKGPLENCALSLQRKRKIRGNQLLPLYSISHHFAPWYTLLFTKRSDPSKTQGRWHIGENNANPLSLGERLQPRVKV